MPIRPDFIIEDARTERDNPEEISRGIAQGVLDQIGVPSLPNIVQGVSSGKPKQMKSVNMPPAKSAIQHPSIIETPMDSRGKTRMKLGTAPYAGTQTKSYRR